MTDNKIHAQYSTVANTCIIGGGYDEVIFNDGSYIEIIYAPCVALDESG